MTPACTDGLCGASDCPTCNPPWDRNPELLRLLEVASDIAENARLGQVESAILDAIGHVREEMRR
jgi:hypothetical protein